jgi:hypothetical protein
MQKTSTIVKNFRDSNINNGERGVEDLDNDLPSW